MMKSKKNLQEARKSTHEAVLLMVIADLQKKNYVVKYQHGKPDLQVKTPSGDRDNIKIRIKGLQNTNNWTLLNQKSVDANQYYAFGSPSEPGVISYLSSERVQKLLDDDNKRTEAKKEKGFKYSDKWTICGFRYTDTRGHNDLPK
jgi:hypothetical protein